VIDEAGELEFKDAAGRAMDAVIASYGIVGKRAGAVDPDADRATKLRLLELVEVEVRVDGQRRMGAFLPRPTHLPDTDDELRMLYESRLAKDKQVRLDLLEWREINRNVAADGANALKTLCHAVADAKELVEAEQDEAERDRIFKLGIALTRYTMYHFGCDPTTAPTDPQGREAWCLVKCARKNPVPEWLRDARGRGVRLSRRRATDAFTGRVSDEDDQQRDAAPDDADESREDQDDGE
jgi:hypothetical protein